MRLNENTSIPVKILVPGIIAIITAVWWLSTQLQGNASAVRNDAAAVRNDFIVINRQLTDLNDKIDGAWSVQNMGLWVAKMQKDNPSMKIPEPSEGFVRRRDVMRQQEYQ